ncbi:hypothetical protein XVE_2374 [Xanthomonas vesicatoria ATCC 35937]|uniref:Uncharacterized protein n=1 Tax=Xanthomonas vesicatoria ATCC 35937 TaxID=925775 RepID=F0BE01_9XANT|nr:hypothetical protein XVE_2374 [Xanthomonas vesicatoria ATCC 35937]
MRFGLFQDMDTIRRVAAVAIARMCRDGDSHRTSVELEETIPGLAGALTEAGGRKPPLEVPSPEPSSKGRGA